jgi:hypothetical protein
VSNIFLYTIINNGKVISLDKESSYTGGERIRDENVDN